MRPLAMLGAAEASRVRGLLFDLDDTLLTRGVLTRAAYDALWEMHDAGLRLFAVTGRPSGWGELAARQWPIDGAIAENGAVLFVRSRSGLERVEVGDEAQKRAVRMRLARIVDEVRSEVPEARLTDDMDMRRVDVTWDIGERVRLPPDRVAAIQRVILAHGARTTRSSVHVHATFDGYDKASAAVRLLGLAFGEDSGAALARYAFIGDSGNDAACFSAFRLTVGVANVRAHLDHLVVLPAYVTSAPMGEGFAELATALVRAKRTS